MTAARVTLEERRDLALRDLVDLEDQVASGELDEATAAALRDRYEADATAAVRALAALEDASGPVAADDRPGDRRRGRGIAVAAAVAAVVAVGATVALPHFLDQRPAGGFVTGNEAVDGQGRDLSEVTNEELEQVVAANPDVIDMRLRLAHRYLDAGQPSEAVDHYMAVLDREDHPEAMSHLGWLVFNDGQVDLALQLLEASRARAPDDPETLWFLANVELYGRDDPDTALQLLEQIAARDDLAQRDELEQVIDEARRRKAAS